MTDATPGKALTADQIAAYARDGYVILKNALTAGEIERYGARARAIAHGEHPPEAKSRIMREVRIAKGLAPKPDDPEEGLWKLMNPDRFEPAFRDFMATPRLIDAIEDLIGPDIIAFLMMVIYKAPNLPDAIHPLHQDAFYFPFGPHDSVLGVWAPVDDADAANGTLAVVPGSHKGAVEPHAQPERLVNFASFGIPGAEAKAEPVPLDVKAGDAVLFHSRLWHMTGGNATPRRRRVLTIHACSAACAMEKDVSVEEFGMRLVRGKLRSGGLTPPEKDSLVYIRHAPETLHAAV